MYKKLRLWHLGLGVGASPLLFLYAVSALQMSHSGILRAETATDAERHFSLGTSSLGTTAEVVQALRDFGLRGHATLTVRSSDSITITFDRPATTHAVTVSLPSGKVRVVTRRGNTLAFLNRLHHLAGVSRPAVGERVWGWVVVATSVALLFLGLSGILLWLKRLHERTLGVLFLTVSLLTAGGLLIAIRAMG